MDGVIGSESFLHIKLFGCYWLQSEEGGALEQLRKVQGFVEELKTLPIAMQTAAANEQHYEATS